MTPAQFYTLMNGEFNYTPPDGKYLVKFKNIQYYLNDHLAQARNISDEVLARIVHWHKAKLAIFEKMSGTDDSVELKKLAQMVEDIEFTLQELWGFPRDANFHRPWDVPKCLCPKLDNEDRLGTPYRITVQNCPIHGESDGS